jgi:hypothetical protein
LLIELKVFFLFIATPEAASPPLAVCESLSHSCSAGPNQFFNLVSVLQVVAGALFFFGQSALPVPPARAAPPLILSSPPDLAGLSIFLRILISDRCLLFSSISAWTRPILSCSVVVLPLTLPMERRSRLCYR